MYIILFASKGAKNKLQKFDAYRNREKPESCGLKPPTPNLTVRVPKTRTPTINVALKAGGDLIDLSRGKT